MRVPRAKYSILESPEKRNLESAAVISPITPDERKQQHGTVVIIYCSLDLNVLKLNLSSNKEAQATSGLIRKKAATM